MNDQIIKYLKENIRTTENDLSRWKIELHKRMEAASEAEGFVEVLQKGLELLKLQLQGVNRECD